MWHRLPFEQEAQAGRLPAAARRRPPRRRMGRDPGRLRHARRRSRRAPFGWDNERPALTRDVPAFAIERHDVTNAHFLEFVEAGGYGDARGGAPEDWAWVQRETIDASAVLGARRRRVALARDVRPVPLPLAWPVYVSQAEAAALCALARRAPADRGGVSARGVRLAGGRAAASVGRRRADADRGVFDFSSWDPEPAGSLPPARARGASRISSATAGSGRARPSRRFPASSRWRRIRNIRPISSTANIS